MAVSRSRWLIHDDPAKAAELGSKGGRGRATNSPAQGEAASPIEPPKIADQLRDLLAEAIAQVKMGKLDIKISKALAYTGTALLRAIEASTFESRLAYLEMQSRRRQGQ